jgi:flagellar biosynthetic protein FliQ
MTVETIIGLGRDTLEIVLVLAGPILLAGLVVGVAVSLFQAVTQINEMTLTLIPKMIAVVAALAVCGPWMLERLMSFTLTVMHELPNRVG